MKILVVQLLRLGDIVLSAPVLRSLKHRYPQAQIHLLINSQFKQVKPLMPFVDKFIGFDRIKTQKKLKYKNFSYFGAFDNYKKLINYLRSENYDQVINLTQNKFSGYLCRLVNCKDTRGLSLGANAVITGQGFVKLNHHGLSNGFGQSHFVDLFFEGLDLVPEYRGLALKETEKGFSEIKKQIGTSKVNLLIQPFTSDNKKNWGLDNFQDFITKYSQQNPNHKIVIMGAPSEKEALQVLVRNLKEFNVIVKLVICTLEGALSLIKRAELLVTGDTSIKHIAAATHTRIIELSMGSSHAKFTGIYKKNCYIIQARESCAPCSHSTDCPYENFPCHSKINPTFLSQFATHVHSRNNRMIELEIQKHFKKVQVYKTIMDNQWGWFAVPLKPSVEDLLDLFLSTVRAPGLRLGFELKRLCNKISGTFLNTAELSYNLNQLNSDIKEANQLIHSCKNNFDFFTKTTIFKNGFLSEILAYHLRAYGYTQVGQIESSSDLNYIMADIKNEMNSLQSLIQLFIENEKGSLWIEKKKILEVL